MQGGRRKIFEWGKGSQDVSLRSYPQPQAHVISGPSNPDNCYSDEASTVCKEEWRRSRERRGIFLKRNLTAQRLKISLLQRSAMGSDVSVAPHSLFGPSATLEMPPARRRLWKVTLTSMEGGLVESGLSVSQQTVAPQPQLTQLTASPSLHPRPRDRRKMPAFLSNLGKATLRGIRRCPQCGIYNGTRGLSCKNKACGAVFRDGAAVGTRAGVKKGGAETVRLVIDGGGGGGEGGVGGTQVFSVRQRGRSVELRGFVELTLTDTAIATPDGTMLTRVSLGRCLMPTCRQGQGQTQGGGERKSGAQISSAAPSRQPESPCTHVKQAMECQTEATPLALKSSVLESLQAPSQVKEELWRLATESQGPLVQRVSRGTLVVKCHANESHPLGLLHLTVAEVRARERQHIQFHCACQATGARRGPGIRTGEALLSDSRGHSEVTGVPAPLHHATSSFSSSVPELCLHFYACVCALTSDAKLAAEFAHFLSYAADGLHASAGCSVLAASHHHHLPDSGAPPRTKKFKVEESLAGIPVWVLSLCPTNPLHNPATASAQGVRESLPASTLRKPSQRKQPISAAVKDSGGSQPVDESHVSLAFQQWLASVTERIHQTMHFQFDAGKPEPLVFHIPQAFFNALQQRLSLGSKKRRLPNFTTAFVRNDALPLGTFSKYTWHITNLLQVKRIFDTPELPLELTQSFVKNSDGSFSPYRSSEVPPVADGHGGTERSQAIRPLELRTFLKVGSSSSEQKGPIPFIIEWIPDILPRSRVGELRIRFEYGHQQSGPVEHGDGVAGRQAGVSGGAGGDGVVGQSLAAPTIEIFRVTVP
ncbi:hypothetical protein GN956_G23850 [Arapaima gigas]